MGQQSLGLDASAMQSMPRSISTPQCDLTWLQLLFRSRCPILVQKSRKGTIVKKRPYTIVLPPSSGTLPASTQQQPIAQRNSICKRLILSLTHIFWKNSLPSSLGNSQLSWSDESRASSQGRSCCHLPHQLRNIRQQQQADLLLCPLHPLPRSPHWGHDLVHMLPTDQTVHVLKQHLATEVWLGHSPVLTSIF